MEHTTSMSSAEMERCAHACHECEDACLATLVHCLDLGGEHASLEHQTVLTDCAAICSVAHNLLHRKSSRHVHTCRACAAICLECAKDCERFGRGDPAMVRCAETCRRCAEICGQMAGA